MSSHLPGGLFSSNCSGLEKSSLVNPSLAIHSLGISILGSAALTSLLAERSCSPILDTGVLECDSELCPFHIELQNLDCLLRWNWQHFLHLWQSVHWALHHYCSEKILDC
jgi:hypothetical protein